jgi:List-Bact-rpt repeat protein
LKRPRGFRVTRQKLALVAATALTLIGVLSAASGASAAVSGQLGAWGEWGTGAGKVFDPSFMGVDSTDGSVYVGSYPADFASTKIQKFSEAGALQGSVSIPTLALVGIAVDHARERFYVLQDQAGIDSRDAAKFVATKILAFSTTPNGSNQLVPAAVAEYPVPPVEEEKTLFAPREIAVDPSNGDLVVLAEDSAGHAVLQRISTSGSGSVGARVVDSGSSLKSRAGIAVGNDGTTYVLTDTAPLVGASPLVQAYTVPAGFSPATLSPLAGFAAAATAEAWPSELDFAATPPNSLEGLNYGPQVALATTADGERTLYWKGVDTLSDGNHAGNYAIHGYSIGQEATSTAIGKGASEGLCRIQTGSAALAAGKDGSLVVLDQGEEVFEESTLPTWFPAVFRFGAGGSGCPGPAAAIKLTQGAGGPVVSSVSAGTSVTLDGSGSELGGGTLADMTWTIEGPGGPTTLHGEKPSQVFATEGQYTIRLNMKTSLFSPIGTNIVAAPKKLTVTAGNGTPEFPLTLSKAGTGSGGFECDGGAGFGGCGAQYAEGTTVTVKAVAAAGSKFANWTGDCSGSGTCQVTMSAARTVGAVFNLESGGGTKFALTVGKGGTGIGSVTSSPAGINCGVTCSAAFDPGTKVTLTAAPSAGSTFAGWGGACAGTGSCLVTLTAATSVTAVFVPSQAGGGGGNSGGGSSGGSGGAAAPSKPGGAAPGGGKTPAQLLAEKRAKAKAKCKKLHGKAKAKCMKRANEIGKPKKKKKP